MAEGDPIVGRGAQKQMNNRFFEYSSERIIELEDIPQEEVGNTQYIPVHPKTIMNKVSSPDLRHDYSLNPYQGCEHGCVYCYARNSHQYWGYNAGLDFEQKILVKHNSPALLRSLFESKNWKASPFMLSGNTDCYQPIERKVKLTRSILELCLEFRHPVGIVTKNYLVTRDLDILTELAKDNLVHVAMSITTLNESLRRKLEPRTTTGAQRIKAVAQLSAAGVPVHVLIAPLIPGLNDTEAMDIVKASAEAGARSLSHIIVRLNGDLGEVFSDWLEKQYPDRKEKVLHMIQACHDGSLQDSRFGTRMRGTGNIADMIAQTVKLAKRKYMTDRQMPAYNLELYEQFKHKQWSLF